MNTKRIAGVATLCVLGSCLAIAQDRGGKKGPPPQMSFFVTSEGGGKGADLGGLAGADALCSTFSGSVRTARCQQQDMAYVSQHARSRRSQRARSDWQWAVV